MRVSDLSLIRLRGYNSNRYYQKVNKLNLVQKVEGKDVPVILLISGFEETYKVAYDQLFGAIYSGIGRSSSNILSLPTKYIIKHKKFESFYVGKDILLRKVNNEFKIIIYKYDNKWFVDAEYLFFTDKETDDELAKVMKQTRDKFVPALIEAGEKVIIKSGFSKSLEYNLTLPRFKKPSELKEFLNKGIKQWLIKEHKDTTGKEKLFRL